MENMFSGINRCDLGHFSASEGKGEGSEGANVANEANEAKGRTKRTKWTK